MLTPPESGACIDIEATVGNCTPQTLYLVDPARADPDWVANPRSKEKVTVSSFWNAALAVDDTTDQPIDLACPTHAFTTTLQIAGKVSHKRGSGKTSDGNDEFKAGKGAPKVVFNVPYLTNTAAIKRGRSVRCPAVVRTIVF